MATWKRAGHRSRARLSLRHFATLPLCHLFLLAPALAQHTGTIQLRPVARIAPGRPVTLADVASLYGPPAEALASVIVLSGGAPQSWAALDAAAVRAAIDEQAHPVWGHVAMLGGECRVRALGPAAPDAGSAELDADGTPLPIEPTSVRGVIEQRLALALGCAVTDLRLEFADRDAELLALSAIGRTVDVQPTGFSERLPLRITIFEGERLLRAEAIRVGVLVRRSVAVSPGGLERGDLIGTTDVTPDTRWLAPDVTPVTPEAAPGLVVRTRITPGSVLTSRDVETPLLIRRGESLQVHAVGGAISLQIPARALEDGREGEIIRCVTLTPPSRGPRSGAGREPAREFLARMAAPGLAIAIDEDPHATSPPEPQP